MLLFAFAAFEGDVYDIPATAIPALTPLVTTPSATAAPAVTTQAIGLSACRIENEWSIYRNKYLGGYAIHCITGNDIPPFEKLSDAKAYIEDCFRRKNITEGGITKESVRKFTIRQNTKPQPSESCEISWVFKAGNI